MAKIKDNNIVLKATLPDKKAVISNIDITPSTQTQNITAPIGIDGFNPIKVNAVTSDIDNNIKSENIKKNISILGIQGSLEEGITPTGTISINDNGLIDVTDYANADVSVDTVNNTSLTITPTTNSQSHTVTSPYTGYGAVTVNAVTNVIDQNITASNIKEGVSILGVNGSVKELKGESRSVSLTNSAGQDFTPTGNNTGITYINVVPRNQARTVTPTTSQQILGINSGYSGNGVITVNAVNSDIDQNITASNIKSGVTILGTTGNYTGTTPTLTTKNITVNGTYNASSDNVDGYSSVTVSVPSFVTNAYIPLEVAIDNALQKPTTNFVWISQGSTIWDIYVLAYAFAYCTGITGANLSSLVNIYGFGALAGTFLHCQNLTNVDLSNLTTIDSGEGGEFSSTFAYCTSLTTLSFPSLTTVTINNTFRNMLQGVSGCTVHFPSSLQSVIGNWSDVVSGFGGTNTTVLFDL